MLKDVICEGGGSSEDFAIEINQRPLAHAIAAADSAFFESALWSLNALLLNTPIELETCCENKGLFLFSIPLHVEKQL